MAGSLLRDRTSHEQARVTYVELFFDLVFVFAITQLSHHLLEHLTIEGAAETALLLLAVWSVWVYTTWATNWLDTNRAPVRLMLLALTVAGLLVSTSIPEALGRHGLTFAIALAVMHNGRNLFLLWCIGDHDPQSRRSFQRIGFWLALAGLCWIAGGLAAGSARVTLWALALTIELGSPWWRYWMPGFGASAISDWRVSPHHMAERCGLFMIIALGESILVTGATFGPLEWTAAHVAAFITAISGSIAMWWVYFATTADEAAAELASSSDPGRLARNAYTYLASPDGRRRHPHRSRRRDRAPASRRAHRTGRPRRHRRRTRAVPLRQRDVQPDDLRRLAGVASRRGGIAGSAGSYVRRVAVDAQRRNDAGSGHRRRVGDDGQRSPERARVIAPRVVIDTPERLAEAFARHFEGAAAVAIRERGRFSCAVPGGSVASTFFPVLVNANVDWSRVDVFWVDERAVPPSDEASNFALASRLWLRHVPVDAARVHRMRGESPDLDEAALAYGNDLTATLGTPPQLDLVLLGVGADGHVASVFPDRPAMSEAEGLVAAVRDAPKPPPERLTLTMATLMAARSICIAAFELEKWREVLRPALRWPDPGSSIPAHRLISTHPDVTVMCTSVYFQQG